LTPSAQQADTSTASKRDGPLVETSQARPARPGLSLPWLFAALAVGVATAAAVGIYPTWQAAGWAGIRAAAVAVGLDLILLLAAAVLTSFIARGKGAMAAIRFFLAAGLVRIGLIIGAGFAAVKLLALPPTVYWCWAAGAYLLLLFIVIRWAGRGLGGMMASARRQPHAPEGQA